VFTKSSTSLVPVLSETYPDQTYRPYFHKIHSNDILNFPSGFRTFLCISYISNACYMLRPSQSRATSFFLDPNISYGNHSWLVLLLYLRKVLRHQTSLFQNLVNLYCRHDLSKHVTYFARTVYMTTRRFEVTER
jgi:hypothetical protein